MITATLMILPLLNVLAMDRGYLAINHILFGYYLYLFLLLNSFFYVHILCILNQIVNSSQKPYKTLYFFVSSTCSTLYKVLTAEQSMNER